MNATHVIIIVLLLIIIYFVSGKHGHCKTHDHFNADNTSGPYEKDGLGYATQLSGPDRRFYSQL